MDSAFKECLNCTKEQWSKRKIWVGESRTQIWLSKIQIGKWEKEALIKLPTWIEEGKKYIHPEKFLSWEKTCITSANEVEKAFREVTEQEEIERIFSEAKKAECVGAALIKCDGNVLPLFAHPSGYGRIALAYGKDQVYSIACSMDTDMDALFAQLSDVARSAGRFVMFDLKKYLPVLGAVCQKNCFDATVAAYLLNPLKNDYTYADVAREQLDLLLEEKMEEQFTSC